MSSVTALEAKTHFGELLTRVTRGEEIVITRHDKPVARLIPEGGKSLANVRSGVNALMEIQKSILKRTQGKARLSDAEVKDAISAGRL